MKKIKICGLSRLEDIRAVNAYRPDYCGFIIDFPKSRRNVSPETAKALRRELAPGITPVGVLVDQTPEAAAALIRHGVVDIIQLHGHEDNDYIRTLRDMTEAPIWQAFQIHSRQDTYRAAASLADFVLLDSGQGSGKTFDWSLPASFPRLYGLAGGLNAGNLARALETGAELLDVSGGVETQGLKDADKIREFIQTVRNHK